MRIKVLNSHTNSVAATAAATKSLQSCPTLCDPIDGSLPGSPVPGILQARTLAWVAISFSSAWKWKLKGKPLSCVWLFATPWTAAYQAPPSMGFPGKSSGVGCHSLLWLTLLETSKDKERFLLYFEALWNLQWWMCVIFSFTDFSHVIERNETFTYR